MKLALTGAHSTGKSTLLRGIVERCSDLRIGTIEEVARKIIKRGFPMGKASTPASYMNFVNDQLRAERLAVSEGFDYIISDRTILDAVAYSLVNKDVLNSPVPDYVIQMLHEVWRIEASFYDLYVYFPIEFSMVSDGIRDEGEDYRHQIDARIEELLRTSDVRHITVRGAPAERLALLEHCLRSSPMTTASARDVNALGTM